MRDTRKSDSVYVLRVLSGREGEPRAGVISSRRVRKDAMSKFWSSLVLIASGISWHSAVVMPFAIVTIELQIDRVTLSSNSSLVMTGRIACMIAREEVVACRQGELLLVMIGKAYFSTMGFASAARVTDTALLV